MKSKNVDATPIDTLRKAQEAARALEESTRALVEEGDSEGIQLTFGKLLTSLDLPRDLLVPLVERAKQRAELFVAEFNQLLKKEAVTANCEFVPKLPFVSIGGVRLHAKSEGKWILSILDSEPLETIRTHDAAVLVKQSIAHIDSIEVALKQVSGFEELLRSAYSAAKGDSQDRVSVNLLMLLCSHGRGLKRQMASAGQLELKSGINRAQFGYLLSELKHSKTGSAFHYHGATQNDGRPEQYIAVPEISDPRKICDCRRITAIGISG